MEPEDVARSYDSLAEKWAGPHFNRANGIAQHRRALAFAPSSGRALDVGCGSSGRILDLLQAHGFVVEGLDLSGEMLRLARIRHPAVTFHHADLCSWQPSGPYAFISAWDSLWHVPLRKQREVTSMLLNSLAPAGVMILSAGGLDQPDEHTNEAMGVPMYHATVGVFSLVETVHDSGCVLRHLEFDQWPEKHLYLVAQKA